MNAQGLLVIGLVMAAAIVLIYFIREAERSRYEILLAQEVAAARKQSVEQSRSTLKGQIAEQLAPILPGFKYLPTDARFLGDPIDYVVFNGRTACADDGEHGDALEVVLLEIKKGQSDLTKVERAIARAVEAGRVRFEICRVAQDGTASLNSWRPSRPRRSSMLPPA